MGVATQKKTLTSTTTETWCSSWRSGLNTIYGFLRKIFSSNLCHIHGAKAYPEPYPVKEAAIRKMLVPTDKASVHRFLGVCHCLSIFFDNLSETVLPLRNLAKDDSAFLWSESHETAFKKYRRLNNGAPLL